MSIDINKLLDEADSLISIFMYDQAISIYRKILDYKPDCADALLMRGALLGEMGKLDQAVIDIEKSIQSDKTNGSAFLTLAYLYEKLGKNKEAIEASSNAIALDSTPEAIKLYVRLCKKLGNQLLEKSQLNEAENYFKLALEHKNDADILYRLSLVKRNKGHIESSIKLAQEAVSLSPNHIRAKAHIASSYELLGDYEKGNKLIEKLNQEHPEHPMVSIIYAQYTLRSKNQLKGISALKNMLNRTDIQTHDRVSAQMFLGKLYDSIKDYDTAFYYFKQANDSLDKNYNPLDYKNYISALINYFSQDKYASIPSSQNTSDELIFIVGMPRSGTSLIEQIISSHSDVFGAGELFHVDDIANLIQTEINSTQDYPVCLNNINTTDINRLADKLLSKIKSENPGSIKVSDKMPFNFHHIGLIHKLLPSAKIINCTRDARDTCISCYFQYFTGYHPYSSNLRSLGIHYCEYERLMNHWINELNIPILNISYESLVKDTRNEIAKTLDFLGLEWQEECIEFYRQKRKVATASYDQVNKKMYSSSIGRWRNYNEYITDLLNALKTSNQ